MPFYPKHEIKVSPKSVSIIIDREYQSKWNLYKVYIEGYADSRLILQLVPDTLAASERSMIHTILKELTIINKNYDSKFRIRRFRTNNHYMIEHCENHVFDSNNFVYGLNDLNILLIDFLNAIENSIEISPDAIKEVYNSLEKLGFDLNQCQEINLNKGYKSKLVLFNNQKESEASSHSTASDDDVFSAVYFP